MNVKWMRRMNKYLISWIAFQEIGKMINPKFSFGNLSNFPDLG
jgi:hypothetical protein